MRLKALRQPPTESPRPMNPRQTQRKSNNNDLPSLHTCYCKHPSPESEKRRRTGQYGTLQGGAAQAPNSNDLHYPTPELTIYTSETHKGHLLMNPDNNKNFPKTSSLTGTRRQTKSFGAESHDNKMRPHNVGERNAWTRPLANGGHTPTRTILYIAKLLEHSEANRPGERNTGKQLEGGERRVESTFLHPPVDIAPPPIKTKPIVDAMTHIDIEASPAPSRHDHHVAIHPDTPHTHTHHQSHP